MNPTEIAAGVQRAMESLRAQAPHNPQAQSLLDELSRLHAGYQELLAQQEALIAEQKSLIQQLQRMLFGPKSEKLDAEQEAQLAEVVGDLKEQIARPEADSPEVLVDESEADQPAQRARRRGVRRPVPVELEVVTTVVEPPEAVCERCGKLGARIGEEVSEQVDLIPAKLIVRRTVRIKRACACGCGGVAIAPLPPALIPGSRLGLGLAVFILLAKYDDHLALYTLERIFRERHGLILPRQQMVQWIEHLAGLLRLIVDRMWARMKQGDYLQIDETPVRVLDPEVKGKAARGYLWFFGVPGGDVFLVFDRGRSHQVPAQQLQGFRGLFQSDDYGVYETLAGKLSGVRRAGCAAHSRRRFYEAALEGDRQGIWFIAQFRRLYRIEDQARDLAPEARQTLRTAQAPAIWAEMKTRAQQLQPLLLPQSTLAKAVRYFLHEYDALQVYLERPDYQIDNNLCENSIRPSCVGKRRWLFIGHPEAGWRSAVIYSILQSCRRRGIDPQKYLTDVLGRLPGMKNTELDALLPENWPAVPARAATGPGPPSG
jgi:transposase